MSIGLIVRLASVVILAGCVHGAAPVTDFVEPPAPAKGPGRCEKAAADAFRLGEGTDGTPGRSQILAALTRACERDGWSDEAQECLAGSTAVKADACGKHLSEVQHLAIERAFEAGRGEPAPGPAVTGEDPACLAAANGSAEAIARDARVSAERREGLLADVRAAVLEPCRAGKLSAELLECLAENEEHFGICGVMAGADWAVLGASLAAHGFSPSAP
jgi:hypothetical protein